MSRRSYPQTGSWERADTDRFFLMEGEKCMRCPHVFGKDEKFWRQETQVSYMRGDDEVESICDDCKKTAELHP